jgi:flagellin
MRRQPNREQQPRVTQKKGALSGKSVNQRIHKEYPMSLGVLNNLNAIYAENNLNATSGSLSKVLQQLSSGSKINSGADDAAGLSLVNGLQANAQALTQSKTNATEGVGLLQVADGALTQVTSLLNRAVTLATEASNGTLDSSQDMAANQEYQSILSEINNIGSTTTYNDMAVFGSGTTNIYTGDSSKTSASIDALTIGSLSSSNLGDTAGVMAYSSGKSVFLNLSSSSANAQVSDAITAGSSLVVTYKNTDQSIGSATITPTTDTVGGLMSAINSAGLGLTASFSTAASAGVDSGTAAGTMTGLQISGAVGIEEQTVGQSNLAEGATSVVDTSTNNTAAVVAGSTGIATISYTSSNGESLSGTSLSTQSDAETALTSLNAAITDVAAQDGYVGAQINTLEAVSSVLGTQAENVTAAQNAVQATDYAAATSNMSKFEILSQTGISALAQANSIQQEVTKLLQ